MPTTIQENNKRIAKNTLMLYFRMFFVLAVSLFTSRVVLQTLGVTDYGIYNVVGGIVVMFGVLNSAMTTSTNRYLTYELGRGDMVRLKQTFSMCFQIYILLSLLILVLGETVGLWFLNNKMVIPESRMMAANWVYQCSIVSCINMMIANPYTATIIAHEKMNIYAYVSIVEVLLKLGIVYLLLVIRYDHLIVYGLLHMLVSLTTTMIYRIYCVTHYKESRYHFYWEKPLFLQLLSFSGWNFYGSVCGVAKGQGLNILLNMFFTPAVNAARGIAYQINASVTMFFTNFYTAVRPQIVKYYAQNDMENMFKLAFRSSKFTFYLIYIVSLPILVETPYIVNLWLGQLPDFVVVFTRLIIIITAIDSMSSPMMTIAQATGKIALYHSTMGTVTMMNLPISYLLLKFYGGTPITVFIVSLVLNIILYFLRLYLVKRMVNFPVWKYIKQITIPTCFIAILALIVPAMVGALVEDNLPNVCMVIVLSFASSAFFIYFMGLTKGEKTFILEAIKKKIRRR